MVLGASRPRPGEDVFGSARKLLDELHVARASQPLDAPISLAGITSLQPHRRSPPPAGAKNSRSTAVASSPLKDANSAGPRSPLSRDGTPQKLAASPLATSPLGADARKQRSPQTSLVRTSTRGLTAPSGCESAVDLLQMSRGLLQDTREGSNRWQQLVQRAAVTETDRLSAPGVETTPPRHVHASSPLGEPASPYSPHGRGATGFSTPPPAPQPLSPVGLGRAAGAQGPPAEASTTYHRALAALQDAEAALPPSRRRHGLDRQPVSPLSPAGGAAGSGSVYVGGSITGAAAAAAAAVGAGGSSSSYVPFGADAKARPVALPAFALVKQAGGHNAVGPGGVGLSPCSETSITLEAEAERLLQRLAAAPVSELHAAAANRPAAVTAAAAMAPLSELEVRVAMAQLMSGARETAQAVDEARREAERQRHDVATRQRLMGEAQQAVREAEEEAREEEEAQKLRVALALRLWRHVVFCSFKRRWGALRQAELKRAGAVMRAWRTLAAAGAADRHRQGTAEHQAYLRKENAALMFWRLRKMHFAVEQWRKFADMCQQLRAEDEQAHRQRVAAEHEERAKEGVSDRFRRLWLIHSHFQAWRRSAAAGAAARRFGDQGQERRRRVDSFLQRLATNMGPDQAVAAENGVDAGAGDGASRQLSAALSPEAAAAAAVAAGGSEASEALAQLPPNASALQRLQWMRAHRHLSSFGQGAQSLQSEGSGSSCRSSISGSAGGGSANGAGAHLEVSETAAAAAGCAHFPALSAALAVAHRRQSSAGGSSGGGASLLSPTHPPVAPGQAGAPRRPPSRSASFSRGSQPTQAVVTQQRQQQGVQGANGAKRIMTPGRMRGSGGGAAPGAGGGRPAGATVPNPPLLSTARRAEQKRQQIMAAAEGMKEHPLAQPGSWGARALKMGLQPPPEYAQQHGAGSCSVLAGVLLEQVPPPAAEAPLAHTTLTLTAGPGLGSDKHMHDGCDDGDEGDGNASSSGSEGEAGWEGQAPRRRGYAAINAAGGASADHAHVAVEVASTPGRSGALAGGPSSASLHGSVSDDRSAIELLRRSSAGGASSSVSASRPSTSGSGANGASTRQPRAPGASSSVLHQSLSQRQPFGPTGPGSLAQQQQHLHNPNGPSEAELIRLRAVEARRQRLTEESAKRLAEDLERSSFILSDLHYRRALLRRCGLGPWLLMWRAAVEQARSAHAFVRGKRLRAAWEALALAPRRGAWQLAGAQAAALGRGAARAQRLLLRTAMRRWRNWQRAARLNRRWLARRVLAGLMRGVAQGWEFDAVAETHWQRRTLAVCLDAWRMAAEQQANRELLQELQSQHDAQASLARYKLGRVFDTWRALAGEAAQQRRTLQQRSSQMERVSGWLQEFRQQRASSSAAPAGGREAPAADGGVALPSAEHFLRPMSPKLNSNGASSAPMTTSSSIHGTTTTSSLRGATHQQARSAAGPSLSRTSSTTAKSGAYVRGKNCVADVYADDLDLDLDVREEDLPEPLYQPAATRARPRADLLTGGGAAGAAGRRAAGAEAWGGLMTTIGNDATAGQDGGDCGWGSASCSGGGGSGARDGQLPPQGGSVPQPERWAFESLLPPLEEDLAAFSLSACTGKRTGKAGAAAPLPSQAGGSASDGGCSGDTTSSAVACSQSHSRPDRQAALSALVGSRSERAKQFVSSRMSSSGSACAGGAPNGGAADLGVYDF